MYLGISVRYEIQAITNVQGRDVKSLEDLAAELLTTARQYTYTGRLEAKHHFFRYRGKVKLRASADVDQQDSADL